MDTLVISLIVAAGVIIVVGWFLARQARRNGPGRQARKRTATPVRPEAEASSRDADRASTQANDLEARSRSERRAAEDKAAESARLEGERAQAEAERQQRRANAVDPNGPRTSGQVATSPDDDLTGDDDRHGRHRI
jgi:hypothetical protein